MVGFLRRGDRGRGGAWTISGPWAAVAMMVTALAWGLPAVLAQDPGAPAEPESPETSSAEAVQATEGESEATPETVPETRPDDVDEDGTVWQWDMDRQQYYTVFPFTKVEGTYKWVRDDRIRVRGGLPFDVVREDEENLYLKAWRWEGLKRDEEGNPPERRESFQSDLELEPIELAGLPATDRLRLEGFDRGLPRQGQWRNGFELADMNGDGHLDIVFGPARKGEPRPHIFLGDGAGSWAEWPRARFPRLPYDYGDVGVGDLDGDGHLDLAFGVHLRGILALLGDGRGGFRPWREGIEFDLPGQGGDARSFSSRALTIVDWDADGRGEIVGLGEGPKGVRLTGDGFKGRMDSLSRGFFAYRLAEVDGREVWHRELLGLDLAFGDDFSIGDFDGNGRPDVVASARITNYREVILMGGEDGTFVSHSLPDLPGASYVTAVTSGDVDGDGRDEVIVGIATSREHYKYSLLVRYDLEDDGVWRSRPLLAEKQQGTFTALAVGELDGDGALDLAAATDRGTFRILLSDGQGGFELEAAPELPPETEGCTGRDLWLEDLDGDGRAELLVSFAGEASGLPGISFAVGCRGQGSIRAWSPRLLGVESGSGPSEG